MGQKRKIGNPFQHMREFIFYWRRLLPGVLFLIVTGFSRAQPTPASKEKPDYLPPRLWEILKDVQPPEVKKLRGEDTTVSLQEVGDKPGDKISLQVGIMTSARILYSQITVKILDEAGNEIPWWREGPKEDAYSNVSVGSFGGGNHKTGLYLLKVNKGYHVATVELQWEGDKQTFAVRQIIGKITDEDLGIPKKAAPTR